MMLLWWKDKKLASDMRTMLDASKKLLQQEEEVVKSRMMVERLKLRQEVLASKISLMKKEISDGDSVLVEGPKERQEFFMLRQSKCFGGRGWCQSIALVAQLEKANVKLQSKLSDK
ncbi:Von Willebrand Factor [Manis pentadactyla]|nr:Von Willebrand Factor [Manis pentadactyla]